MVGDDSEASSGPYQLKNTIGRIPNAGREAFGETRPQRMSLFVESPGLRPELRRRVEGCCPFPTLELP